MLTTIERAAFMKRSLVTFVSIVAQMEGTSPVVLVGFGSRNLLGRLQERLPLLAR
jgi:hypothetical protein